jgi:hypothetical protein
VDSILTRQSLALTVASALCAPVLTAKDRSKLRAVAIKLEADDHDLDVQIWGAFLRRFWPREYGSAPPRHLASAQRRTRLRLRRA